MYRSTLVSHSVGRMIGYRMADAFFRSYRLVVITFLIIFSVTLTAVYLRSKSYSATALTQVVTDNVASALGEQQTNDWISPAQKNVNQLDVLLNGDFLAQALSNAQLQHPINTDPSANDPRFALLKKKLNTFVQADTLFGIELTWDNPQEAEEITRAIQNQYIQEIGQENFAQRSATLAFLDSQINTYAARLQQEESLLTKYKASNPNGLPEAQDDAVGQLSALQAQLDNMKITSHDAAEQKAVLEQRLAQIKPETVAEETSAPSPLTVQLNDLKARRDALLITMRPTHPLVMALNDQITRLEQKMASLSLSGSPEAKQVTQTKLEDNPEWQTVHAQILQADIDQQSQAMQMKLLAQKVSQYTALVQKIPAQQRLLTDKTRDYQLIQTQYDSLLQRRQQVQMEANLARVSASSSLSPIGYIQAEPTTGRAKMAAMAVGCFLLSLILSLLLLVLTEWADHSLRYSSDAERALGLPVLSVVPDTYDLFQPKPVRPAGRGKGLLANKDKSRPVLEAPPALGMSASAMEGSK